MNLATAISVLCNVHPISTCLVMSAWSCTKCGLLNFNDKCSACYEVRQDSIIHKGRIVSFNKPKGFGFISTASDADLARRRRGNGIFVHVSDVKFKNPYYRLLKPGQSVEFKISIQSDGRKKAVNVTGPNGSDIDVEAQQLVKI